jgi:phosphopantetheine--protein transferase-like protein
MTGAVDLYWFRDGGDSGATAAAADLALLSGHEQAELDRFERPKVVQSFARRRAFRRRVLAGYFADVHPSELTFGTNKAGKPFLELQHSSLHFNASHGRAGGVVVVSEASPLGVDIEFLRPIDEAAFAERILSPKERQLHLSNPPEARLKSIFTYWTVKEALIKALGIGLNLNLLPRMSLSPVENHADWYKVHMSRPLPNDVEWFVWSGSLSDVFAQPTIISVATQKIGDIVVRTVD